MYVCTWRLMGGGAGAILGTTHKNGSYDNPTTTGGGILKHTHTLSLSPGPVVRRMGMCISELAKERNSGVCMSQNRISSTGQSPPPLSPGESNEVCLGRLFPNISVSLSPLLQLSMMLGGRACMYACMLVRMHEPAFIFFCLWPSSHAATQRADGRTDDLC